jgi:Flagellar basal body rod FlgEFG protein C-terminal
MVAAGGRSPLTPPKDSPGEARTNRIASPECPMVSAISTATNGLAVQSHRVEKVAQAVASAGATRPASTAQVPRGGGTATQVRIGALPVGVSVERMVTLVEAQNAYEANAAVIETASDMLGSLLDTVDPK